MIRSSVMRSSALVVPLLAALALSAAPAAAALETLDEGRMIVYQHGKAVRVEDFTMDRNGDTLVVRAGSYLGAAGPEGGRPDKTMALQVDAPDYGFVRYQSEHIMGPDTLKRGVETSRGDTLCTIWREINNYGEGTRVVLPPGRLYVLDPPLFTTFTFIARTLHGRTFEQRPIEMLVLSPRDSMVEATVTNQGTETIRWGARPVVARKLLLADTKTRFTLWVAPDGRMLKLEQAESGITVERQAPPLKRRTPAPPPKPQPKK
jgi:hypothetical protein